MSFVNLQPGSIVANKYEVLRSLGAGSMGMVYACTHKEIPDHIVALKVLFNEISNDSVLSSRFKNEIYASYGISHPNVVKAYEYVEEKDFIAFSMEFVDGGDLADLLEKNRDLTYNEIFKILTQIVSGLEAIHASDLVHRDLKPENILLTADGDVKIADFGIVRSLTGPRLTDHGGVIGTIEYVSPEYLANNQVDSRSDIFSLGVLAYEMITLQSPFDGDTLIEVMQKKLKEDPESISKFREDCPEKLEEIVFKCLEKDPEKRYQDAKEILEDIKSLAKEIDIDLPSLFKEHLIKEEEFSLIEIAKRGKTQLRVFIEKVSRGKSTSEIVKSISSEVQLKTNDLLFSRMKSIQGKKKQKLTLSTVFLWGFVFFVWLGLALSLLGHYRPEIFGL